MKIDIINHLIWAISKMSCIGPAFCFIGEVQSQTNHSQCYATQQGNNTKQTNQTEVIHYQKNVKSPWCDDLTIKTPN